MPVCVCFFIFLIIVFILGSPPPRRTSPVLDQKSSKHDTTSRFWYSAASLTFSWLAAPSLRRLLGPPASSLPRIRNVPRPAALGISETLCFHATSPGSSPPSPSQTPSQPIGDPSATHLVTPPCPPYDLICLLPTVASSKVIPHHPSARGQTWMNRHANAPRARRTTKRD